MNTQPIPQMPPVMNVNPPMEAPVYMPPNPPMEAPLYMPPNPPIIPTPPLVQMIPVIYADIPRRTSTSNDRAPDTVRKQKPTVKTSYMVIRDNRVVPTTPKWPPNNARIITQNGLPYLSAPSVPQGLSESHLSALQDQSQC